MRIEVRDSVNERLLGTLELRDLTLLRNRYVRFACAANPRFYGYGRRELPSDAAEDLSFASVDFEVGMFSTPPTIGAYGGYYSGRTDFVLKHKGPSAALTDIVGFEQAR